MKYLVKTRIKRKRSLLYVADTHTFDLKGRLIVSLTDLREYAQEFSIKEASEFVKLHRQFVIEELDEEEDYDNE